MAGAKIMGLTLSGALIFYGSSDAIDILGLFFAIVMGLISSRHSSFLGAILADKVGCLHS